MAAMYVNVLRICLDRATVRRRQKLKDESPEWRPRRQKINGISVLVHTHIFERVRQASLSIMQVFTGQTQRAVSAFRDRRSENDSIRVVPSSYANM